MNSSGSLHVRVSMMYGGKTVFLVRLVESLGRASRILYINHTQDTRGDTPITTHAESVNPLSIEKYADVMWVNNLLDLEDSTILNYTTVCIDEGQFMPDLYQGVLHMVEDLGREVYVVGLKGDYKRGKFGYITDLLEIADTFSTLETFTLCDRCANFGQRKNALFTHRIEDISGAQIEIGSKNYIPVCRECYIQLNKDRAYFSKTE